MLKYYPLNDKWKLGLNLRNIKQQSRYHIHSEDIIHYTARCRKKAAPSPLIQAKNTKYLQVDGKELGNPPTVVIKKTNLHAFILNCVYSNMDW
jgi:hypothetical protein